MDTSISRKTEAVAKAISIEMLNSLYKKQKIKRSPTILHRTDVLAAC